MSDRIDNTTGFLDDGWVHPPTPGTPSHPLIDAAARLMAQSDSEVHQEPSGTGLQALAWAQDRIERSQR